MYEVAVDSRRNIFICNIFKRHIFKGNFSMQRFHALCFQTILSKGKFVKSNVVRCDD